jgi:phage terminase large subunit GpA-like protein
LESSLQTYQQTRWNLPDNITPVITHVRTRLIPRKRLLPADWADEFYIISEGSAKGQHWNTRAVEYTRKILNAIVDPNVEEISVQTSSQILKTTILLIITSYFIEHKPLPMLILYPTIDSGEKFSKTKLEPTLNNIDSIKDRLLRKSRDGKNTTLFKEIMPGVFIIIAGANSPQGLAANSVSVVLEDDIDRIAVSAGNEGDPCYLAEQRVESFKMVGFKIIRFSTPTNSGQSRIEAQCNLGTKEYFEVPCVHCGKMQRLEFFPKHDKEKDEYYGGIIWDKEKDLMGKTIKHFPETARYRCLHCRQDMYEYHKAIMRRQGVWVPTNPAANKHLSFVELGRQYSPVSTWVQMVDEWLKTKEDPGLIKVFYNTVLGKPYHDEAVQEINQAEVQNYVEHYLTESDPFIPNEILFLNCAIDTHPDRFEIEIDGWGLGEENWIVDYHRVWGDPGDEETKKELDEYLFNFKRTRRDGLTLELGGWMNKKFRNYATFIDSGGYGDNTQDVYEYVAPRQYMGIIAIKGRKDQGMPILLNQSRVGKNKDVFLQNIGTYTLKETIWNRLKYPPGGPRTIHYTSAICDYKYFDMLFAEPPFVYFNRQTNTKQIMWKKRKKGIRNEAWDLKNYLYAQLKYSNINLEALKIELDKKVAALNNTPPAENEETPAAVQQQEPAKLPQKKYQSRFKRYSPNI